jgi:excisionase family DNA binding protein
MNTEPQFLTIDELAANLGVSTRTIRRRLADGSLCKAPLGGRSVRIPLRELPRLLGNDSDGMGPVSLESEVHE